MLKIVLCDDNKQFLEQMKDYVLQECKKQLSDDCDFQVGPEFTSGEDLLQYVNEEHVDVLLLDIDMPSVNGFDVARVLCDKHKDIKIVFVSAYDSFVYNAFEFYPFAYMRKTHIAEEFPKILKRIVELLRDSDRRIVLNTTTGAKVVKLTSVLFAESQKNYYCINTSDGEEYLCRGTLSELEKSLIGADFFRIHSAYVINLEHVERLLEGGWVLVGSKSLPVAQKRARSFKKAYMEYVRRCFGS